MATQVFDIPGSGGNGYLALLLLPVALMVALAAAFWPRPLRVEVTPDAVQIRGSIYGRSVPRAQLKMADARIVDLGVERSLAPTLRTNGVGLPNYRVGWFRLRDGERALCFLTHTDSVLYLPTTENYALLISTSSPSELLAALQQAG